MAHSHSSVLTRFNPQRRAIFTMLLNTGGREWTVATLTESLRRSVPPDFVQTTLDALLAHELMTQAPGHQTTTVRLTDEGATALAVILDQWRRGQDPSTTSVTARGTAPVPKDARWVAPPGSP